MKATASLAERYRMTFSLLYGAHIFYFADKNEFKLVTIESALAFQEVAIQQPQRVVYLGVL